MQKIKTIIVDDHNIFLEGISSMLLNDEDVEIIKTFNIASEALFFLKNNEIDLLISDISMPEINGPELIEKSKKIQPNLKTLFISMYHELKNFDLIDGYILKDSTFEEVKIAIHTIFYQNKRYISPSIPDYPINSEEVFILSKREKEIIDLISKEFSTLEIAEKLFISKHTVEAHRKNIFSKLQVKNIAGLIKKSFYLGIIK